MIGTLQEKITAIAGKYADLVEKQIDDASKSKDASKVEFGEINEGIRMLHQIAATLWKLDACDQGYAGVQKKY